MYVKTEHKKMKKKLYKTKEEINRLCISKKLIQLRKQDYHISIYLSMFISVCIVYICISGHPNY